jgi:hypothetical protein
MKAKFYLLFLLIIKTSIVFSQLDTIKWGRYLYIKSTVFENEQRKYIYEFQDTLGNIIIPRGKYEYLEAPDKFGYILAYKKLFKDSIFKTFAGFIDIDENILIPFEYSRAAEFNYNLAWVEKNDLHQFINRKGEIVIDSLESTYFQFKNYEYALVNKIVGISRFHSKISNRIVYNTKAILIDTLGNKIIGEDEQYQKIEADFSHSKIIRIKSNDKYAFFNYDGKQISEFIFDELYPVNICKFFPKHYSCEDLNWFYKGLLVVKKFGQFTIIDESINELIPLGKFQLITPMNSNGVMIIKKDNKFGLLNENLETVQDIIFDTISNISALKRQINYPTFWAKKGDRYYIFDSIGNWKDSIEYDNILLLRDNFYLVTKDKESWRLDRHGERIIENFEVVKDDEIGFKEKKKESKYGLIDYNSDIIIPFEFEDIFSTSLQSIFVKKNGKWGLMDNNRNQLLSCEFEFIVDAWDNEKENKNYIVVKNGKFGKVSIGGKEIFPFIYDAITTWVEYGPKGHYVLIGEKMGLIDYNGNINVPIEFESVESIYGTNLVEVIKDGKMGVYDIEKKSFLIPAIYDIIKVESNWFSKFSKKDYQSKIITKKDGIINLLDIEGQTLVENVSNEEILNEFDFDLNSYEKTPCTYPFLCMIHNKTFKAPDCLLKILKEYNLPEESVYYKMSINN